MKFAVLLVTLGFLPHLSAAVITAASGTGDGVSYSVTFAGNTANLNPSFNPNGDLLVGNPDEGFPDAATVTITFSAPVNFTFATAVTAAAGPLIFDGGFDAAETPLLTTSTNTTNTFAANAGSWIFTPGSLSLTRPLVKSNSGSTLTFGVAAINTDLSGTSSDTPLRRGDDFGTATINGVTEIIWTKTDATNREAFNFSFTAVPEPGSAALCGISLLGLALRRRRA